jgi:hypothetical protein
MALAGLPDTTPPALVRAVATSFDTIEVEPSEPVDPASVQPADFTVQMAGVPRTIASAQVTQDGARIVITSSTPWQAGEAGTMRLSAPGAIADRAGNASGDPADVRVGGAPGDFTAPVVTKLKLTPARNVCWTKGPRCKHPRTKIRFTSSEDGDTYVTVFRGRRLIGERRFSGRPGPNAINFDGKIVGRRLSPGRYRMFVAVEDAVGNRIPLDQQQSAVFTVKSTRARR